MDNQKESFFQTGKAWAKKHPVLSVFGILFLIGFIGMIVDPVEKSSTINEIKQVQQVVFDIPNLIGKNIDEVEVILGKIPLQDPTLEQSKLSDEWIKDFKIDNYNLTVTYNIKTKIVKDLFVSAPDEIYENGNKEFMYQITNTSDNDFRYIVSFVKAIKDPSKFTGILVTPK